MIFYVYLAPEAIKVAYEEGGQSIQALIAVLRSLSKNCFLVDFDNYQVQNQIRDFLEDLLGEYDITVLKKILKYFVSRNLFVNSLEYDYTDGVEEIDMILGQSEKCDLDLILLDDDSGLVNELPIEISTIGNYQITNFETLRGDLATVGITLASASLTDNEFLEKYFKKALKYAQTLEIFDYQCGEKYKTNYEYTLRKFLDWLQTINSEDLRITFHCGFPGEESNLFEKDELKGLDFSEIEPKKKEKISHALNSLYGKSKINIVCYDSKFAHDRFIISNQLAFSIGIGMDFLHNTGENKGKIRDISINFKDAKEIRNLIDSSN